MAPLVSSTQPTGGEGGGGGGGVGGALSAAFYVGVGAAVSLCLRRPAEVWLICADSVAPLERGHLAQTGHRSRSDQEWGPRGGVGGCCPQNRNGRFHRYFQHGNLLKKQNVRKAQEFTAADGKLRGRIAPSLPCVVKIAFAKAHGVMCLRALSHTCLCWRCVCISVTL